MTARTLSMIIVAGLAVATSAHADSGGDIVDQTLRTLPPLPAGSATPSSVASMEPPGAVSGPSGPIVPASASAAVTLGSGDIVDQVLRTLPPVAGAAPPPAAAVVPSAPAPLPPPSVVAATQPPVGASPPVVAAPTPLAPPANPPPAGATVATIAAPLPAAPPKPVLPVSPAAAVTLGSNDIADQPPPAQPVFTTAVSWQGLYVGGNFGGGWTHGGTGDSCTNSQTGTMSGCVIIGNSGFGTSGVFGGGQIGYQRPVDLDLGSPLPLILGVETDIQGSGISGSQNISGPFHFVNFPEVCSPCNYSAKQSLDWFGTLRLKVGVLVEDDVLVYATGGLIYGGVTAAQNLSFLGTSQAHFVNEKSTLNGPTVGAGVEFRISGPWSAKLEGLYYDLGDLKSVAVPVGGAPSNFSDSKTFGFHGGMIRLGINYKLGEPGAN